MSATWIAFHITDRCQLNCYHCLRDPGQKALDIELSLVERVLDQAAQLYGIQRAGLTGGEPTLHPQFYEIVDAIVDRGMTWHMISNAERFPRVIDRLRARPERLEALTIFNFSLDGATRETHDSIRGEGSFDTVMRAAAMCASIGKPFLLQMTVNARNVHEVEQFVLLCAEIGAEKADFNMTNPTGTFLDKNLYLPPRMWKQVRARLDRLRDAFRVEIRYPDALHFENRFHVCSAMQSQPFHVNSSGELNLCCYHSGVPHAGDGPASDVAGNLRDISLAEAHGNLLDIIHQTQQWRRRDLAAGDLEEWHDFPCNWCMKAHGKPYWSGAGAAGPSAGRERWRGAWAPGYKESHVDAGVTLGASDDVRD